jgi:3-hydroxymyristoyl/3-hydroxydecanoyl-(acyl carrier protein) dehydratase
MWQSTDLHFAADHPTAAGHFPANPIIPGALLLDEVLAAIADDGALMIRAAKFLHPVRPGESLTLRWQSLPTGTIKFECRLAGGEVAASGLLDLGPVPS